MIAHGVAATNLEIEQPTERPASGCIRMLYFVREPFPTFRVDIDVLFGRELAGRGHEIDFVMQAADERTRPGPIEWCGRTVWVGRTDTRDRFMSRIRKHLLGYVHEFRLLSRVSQANYDAIQV